MTAALALQPDVPDARCMVRPGVVLRPYQRAAVDSVFDWCGQYDGHPLITIPTGGGKSLVMGTVIKEAMDNYQALRALILAHRKELIQQNVRAVTTAMPLAAIGIYSAGLKQKNVTAPVIVGGIQSVARRPYDLGPFDLILIDEAHLVPTEDDTLYRKFIKAAEQMNPHVRFIGLTATPFRMGSGLLHRGRGALFTDVCYEAPVRQLIDDGYLCPLISRATLERLKTEGVATRGGEFVPGQLEKAVDVDELTLRVVEEMIALCAGRNKLLIFCAGVSHAEHVAAALRARDIGTAAIHGDLSAADREHRLAAFRSGQLRALTSVDVLTTGYDEPAIDAVILLRPTKSVGLYIQQVGRGFRLHPSKDNTLILDFAGNVARHGPVDEIVVDERKAKGGGEAPTKECPKCHVILIAGRAKCPHCGHQFPPPERPPILPEASMAPVLSTEQAPIEWYDVTEVQYDFHVARGEGKRPTMRVEYYTGFRRVASEWVCIEHEGFARRKAEHWWAARSVAPMPDNVEDAVELARGGEVVAPLAIAVQPEGRWMRVIDYKWTKEEEEGDGLPF